ncbi:hypothetical protein VQ03_05060 [Methylobacterium tarhaniae]|uniref:Uncharacterized protein n=1 Tax=Methylobacterium tarhaniae TaxID=1187852 RepID=A0A0J6TE12_9HYPH|nr:hypothetical protein [Methylobacterium tarhaniae]KMO44124.1 hypothetical protein VQ03_05060 [Methylobacterium tarhaniae]
MADLASERSPQHRAARARGLARHRPRPTPADPRPRDRSAMRATDIVLVLAGLGLLGALAIWGSIALAGRALAP